MNRLGWLLCAGVGIFGAVAVGFAQDRGRDAYYQPRDPYYQGAPYYGGQDRYYRPPAYSGAATVSEVEQVRSDLDEVINRGYLSHGDRKTLARARRDLDDFQREWTRGHMSFHELNEAITRVQSVADSSRLSDRARNILQDDANRLRDLRSGGQFAYR